MATRVESSKNLVDVQSVAFIRAINLALRLDNARPNTPMNVFFDGVKVNHHCTPLAGVLGAPLLTDINGTLRATFSVPAGVFPTGVREIFITDAATIADTRINGSTFGTAKATFTATGVQQIWQTTTTITDVETVIVEQVIQQSDPLAQSFFTYGVQGGCFLTSIDLYFNTKDETVPVRVDIRPLVNGYPDKTPIDSSYICSLVPSQVNVSSNASVATKFAFEAPVYLEADKDYCFVVFSNSKNYNLFTSKMGERAIETGRLIYDQPYVGSLFRSENNITWTAEQFEDIKFNINIAEFDTGANAVVKFKVSPDYFGVIGDFLSTTSGSNVVRVESTVQHGLETDSKVFVGVDTAATYNGIPAANLGGERTITAVSEYVYTFQAASAASSSGKILTGGQVREVQVDVGGSNYTSAPTVAFSGGGGTGAAATAVIDSGKVVAIRMTAVGSGYTSAPSVTLNGGGGSGAIATAVIDAAFSILTNKPANFLIPNIPSFEFSSTSLTAKVTTTQLNYQGGNLQTYNVGEVIDMATKGRTYLNLNALIASSYNEVSKMGGNPSMVIEYNLRTSNPNVSPLLDLRHSPSIIAYSNRLKNQVGEDLTAGTSTGVVAAVALSNPGSGYISPPTVSFIGDGTGAEATVFLGTTAVSSVVVGAGGSGYTSAPTVAFSGGGGTGAAATAVLAGTSVSSATVTSAGTGYTSEPSIAFSGGGGGTGAAATAVLSTASVSTIDVTAGGTGYTVAPTVDITGGGGTGATATATISGGAVTTITVTAGGSGYTSVPTVSITGGDGSGATATANLSPRTVASITITNGGSGYTVSPSMVFSGGGGTGAAATANLSPRAVASVTVTSGGSGYTSAPTVAFSGGGGASATATALIAGKSIDSVVVTNPGSDYSEPPEVVLTRIDGSSGVNAIASSTLTTFNSEISANRGTNLSRYVTKKFTLETPSTGVNLFSEIYSEQASSVDWYIRTSLSGSGVVHDDLEWLILNCDVDRNKSTKLDEAFDYKFYAYDIPEFDTYDLKCVLRSTNPSKAPKVNNYRAIIVA